MAGYSKTPAWKKLGIKEGMRVIHLNAPANYRRIVGEAPPDTTFETELSGGAAFLHYFATEKRVLSRNFARLKKSLRADGALWISWPKMASGVATDLDENVVRAIGLRGGLVDVKVAAIDDTWSGLKFVFRVKDRK